MDWEAIGAIGEIVGAIAVVATLGYLASQIRQNTKTARSATRQAIAQMTMSTGTDLVNDPELAEIFLKNLEGQELSKVEGLRLLARSYIAFRNYENIHYQYLSGMLTDDEWKGFRLNLKAVLHWDIMRTYWKNEHQYYSQTFQELVEAILSETEQQPSSDYEYIRKGDF